jgi:hypothetical protein
MGWEGINWISLSYDADQWTDVMNTAVNILAP